MGSIGPASFHPSGCRGPAGRNSVVAGLPFQFPRPSLMDDNTAAANRLRIPDAVVPRSHFVVIDDHPAISRVGNLDPESIRIPVRRCQHEVEISHPVDRAGTFVLRLRAGNYEPVVTGAVEIEVAHL